MKKVNAGGGFPAIMYTWRKAKEVGGFRKLWKAMRTRNACKTCALGMGGQKGGMVNEQGHFPEVCKKSLQAMVADMQGAIQPQFWANYSVKKLQSLSPRELEHCGRLTQPVMLKRGDSHYRPLSWDEAYSKIATKLKAVQPDQTFWYFSGRSSNEAGFLLQLFARIFGTNHVNNCSYYCHQASGVGLGKTLGSGTGTLTLEDLESADLVFVIGGNPASNHPRLLTTLKNLRRRGGEVIVINPIRETGMVKFRVPSDPWSLVFGSKIASLYIQPHIGGDLALLTGVAKKIVEMGKCDETFLNQYCDGWSSLKSHLLELSWQEIIQKSGVSEKEIEEVALRYSKSKNAVFSWTMGITHHLHGVENVEAISNLALLRGMVGRKNAGLMPIRGHSNVQGMGSVGVTPELKKAIFEGLQTHFKIQLPSGKGMDTMACMESAFAGKTKFALCLGGNLWGSNPDAKYAAQAMGKIETVVYMSTTLNTGHAWGLAEETLILPVLARDEEPQATTQESMFSYVRLSDGGAARHEGPKSEVEVIAHMASEVLGDKGPIPWKELESTRKIRETMGAVIPGLEKMAQIDQTKEEFQIGGRTFHEPKFPTPNGKAKLIVHDLPLLNSSQGKLRLMTLRSEGQFNTVVYEDDDLYRGIEGRDVVLLNPDDISSFGFNEGERIHIKSEVGEMTARLIAFDKIRSGNCAMYYPESNILVPRHVDPQSKTPAFKNTLVELIQTLS